jgi:hydroxyacylglutathione hydrolase
MARPLIVPLVDEGLGNSSYLIDLGNGRCLAVDPSRDPAPYLAEAQRRGLRIAFAVETHLHADFVSGSRELAAHGASVFAPASGGLRFPHRGLGDGDEVDLDGLTLRALATPGHTPEHLSYLLLDGTRPVALFTGGSLLVGAVARTDLISPDSTEGLAREMYRSVRGRLLTLPDDLPVYPTHGAGSFCSAPAGAERTTTIGLERATNPLLAAPDEDAFVAQLLDGFGSYPPYFLRLRGVNRSGPRVYGQTPSLRRLTAAVVRQRMGEGDEVVDVRSIAAYAAGHVPGSLSIALRPAFASWLGWLVSPDRPIIAVLDADQDRTDLVNQALKVGYEHLTDELEGGMAAWRAAGFEEQRLSLVDARRMPHVPLLDVRQDAEYRAGHIPGAVSVELGSLTGATDLEPGPLAVMCGHGERAMTGASVLERTGRNDLAVVVGGPDDWAAMPGNRLAIDP